MTANLDVIVIGTGEAARPVAHACREAGRSVAVIDSLPFGGAVRARSSSRWPPVGSRPITAAWPGSRPTPRPISRSWPVGAPGLLDRVAAGVGEETRRGMVDAYLTSSRYELAFWESAGTRNGGATAAADRPGRKLASSSSATKRRQSKG